VFVPGQELSRRFYREVVGPLVGPWPHGAALLGWGSDVLGYDTERSIDHGWGPRLQLFVRDADQVAVSRAVESSLPDWFEGRPVRFGWDGMAPRHWVGVSSLPDWLSGQLGVDASRELATRDWLLMPQQLILEVVRGAVYADPTGELTAARSRLAWYPNDVWLWLMASAWHRIGQEEHLVGRAAEVGDELGSRLVAGRLVRDVVRLSFLQERAYCPYLKWLGTAFRELDAYAELAPILNRVLAAGDYPAREGALIAAYEVVARRHNALGVADAVDPAARTFHDRPFRVLLADRVAQACRAAVADTWLRALPLIGSVDQVCDSTDVLSSSSRPRALASLYDTAPPGMQDT
jgi:hypothetical protein